MLLSDFLTFQQQTACDALTAVLWINGQNANLKYSLHIESLEQAKLFVFIVKQMEDFLEAFVLLSIEIRESALNVTLRQNAIQRNSGNL